MGNSSLTIDGLKSKRYIPIVVCVKGVKRVETLKQQKDLKRYKWSQALNGQGSKLSHVLRVLWIFGGLQS